MRSSKITNFPIDLFHIYIEIPRKPTFGIKLGEDRNQINEIDNVGALLYSSFNAARELRDFEFIFKNQEFKQLVGYVELKDFNWLDFSLSDDDKIKLFIKGVEAACKFLKSFDWKKYKELRKRNLAEDVKAIVAA